MKKITFILILIFLSFLSFSQIPTGYYDSAEGLTGEDLKAALHNIIDDHIEFSYDAVRYILDETDTDPNNSNNLILLYKGNSINNDWDGGSTWNREHVWAKSHGDFGNNAPAGTDLHHLRPTDPSVNSSRGNKDFDNGGTQHDEATECYYTDHSWEPRDAVKGDVARMIFYMEVRYEGDESGEPDLEMVDYINSSPSKEPYHGKKSILLQWHNEDPVDDFERDRNEVIYSYQNNRNPFIDHPEYVDYIWGSGVPEDPIITEIEYSPASPIANEAISVSANVTDNGSVSSVSLSWGTDGSTFPNTITMSNTSGDVYETNTSIPGQSDGITIYFKIEATDDESNTTTSSTVIIEITNAVDIINEDFTNCPPVDWVIYSISGNENWECESGTLAVNAYGGDNPSDDWVITSSISTKDYINETLTFKSWTQYTDNFYPPIEVKYSSDYIGSGNPDDATWTDLNATFAPEDSQEWTNSGDVDLDGITDDQIYIGFRYTSSGNGASTCASWKIDDVVIKGEPSSDVNPPTFASGYPKIENFTEVGFDVFVKLNEEGKVYYKIVEEGSTAPANTEILQSSSITVSNYSQDFSTTITGLSHSTSYDVYLLAEDDEATPNVQTTATKITTSTLEIDDIAPEFVTNYPMAKNVGGTSFDLYVMLNEPGTVYYLLKDDNAAAPTIEEIKAGEAIALAEDSTEYFGSISELTPQTNYDIYIIAEDDEDTPNTQSAYTLLEVQTSEMDVQAPSFITNYPNVDEIAADSAKFNVQLDEKGEVFYKVQLTSETTPSIETLKTSDSFVVELANTTSSISMKNLNAETEYIVYCIASDDETAPNFQDNITTVSFTTIGYAPAITTQPENGNVCEGASYSFNITATSSTDMEYQWYKNETIIDGATSNTYDISATTIADNGDYYCAVENSFGISYSEIVSLLVDEEVFAGKDTNFMVCDDVNQIDLFDYLEGANQDGIFFDNSESGALIRNIFDISQVDIGSYNFTYIVEGGACEDDYSVINVTVDECTGIREMKLNPFTSYFDHDATLHIKGDEIIGHIELFNIFGQRILSSSNVLSESITINCDINTGFYIIRIKSQSGTFTQKIYKQ